MTPEKESLKALQAELAVKETRAKFHELQAAAKAAEVTTHHTTPHTPTHKQAADTTPNNQYHQANTTPSPLLVPWFDRQDKTLNISIDMARQYSSMKQQLLTQITTLEQTITQQAATHTADRTSWASERSEWIAALRQREQWIEAEKARREEMAAEFGGMLQKTLDKMGERLEVTNEWEGQEGTNDPTVRTLEEFSIGGGKNGLAR